MIEPAQKFINKHFTELTPKQKEEVSESLRKGAYPSNDFYLMVALAAVIATLGIITGNAVVVIGAMVVAPLMLPVLSFSMAGVNGDVAMFHRSIKGEAKGAVLAIAVAAAIAFIVPGLELNQEFLIRTSPTLLDLVVAFASGLAGAYAISKRMDYTLPGVAVSVSIIPPLCVAGISIGAGLGIGFIGGAMLLFLANIIAINLAGYVVFWMVGLGPKWYWDEEGMRKNFYKSMALMLIIAIPMGWIMWNGLEEKHFMKETREVLEAQLSGAKIGEITYSVEGEEWGIAAEIDSPSVPGPEKVAEMQEELSGRLGKEVTLELRVTLVQAVSAEG